MIINLEYREVEQLFDNGEIDFNLSFDCLQERFTEVDLLTFYFEENGHFSIYYREEPVLLNYEWYGTLEAFGLSDNY